VLFWLVGCLRLSSRSEPLDIDYMEYYAVESALAIIFRNFRVTLRGKLMRGVLESGEGRTGSLYRKRG
jgi:hypothetical protein